MQLPFKVPSIAILVAATLFLTAVNTEALSPPIEDIEEDEEKPLCPAQCGISKNTLSDIAKKIIEKEAFLVNDSCQRNKNGPGLSFKFEYSLEEVKELSDDFRRHSQAIVGQGPPMGGGMPPIEGFNQTTFGWRIESNDSFLEGTCFTAPNVIKGPFPHANLTSCVHDFEIACFRITNELIRRENQQCPCYDKDEVQSIKQRLMKRIYDPDFQVDMELSCKNPEQNNGFPYGLYTKPNGIKNKMYGSTLRLGVDVNLNQNTMLKTNVMNKCYYTDDHREPRLTFLQHNHCKSLMGEICAFVKQIFKTTPESPRPPVKKPNPSSSCSDNDEFRFEGNEWKSCKNMVEKASRSRKKRACKRYDYDTKKFVFQHCRKSCKMCTCVDRSEFYINSDPKYNCDWLKTLTPKEKKNLCKKKDVAENCIASCSSKCCKNSERFSYYKKIEYGHHDDDKKRTRKLHKWDKRTCTDVTNANWREECRRKSVAVNCPMKCRKCFIQPRMGK